jgi:uncharacterized protein with HEPN domain
MRRDAAFLDDILEAAESIRSICAGQDVAAVAGSKVLRAAILHHLTVIGEAAKRLSPELRATHDSLPWPHIIS